MIRSFIGDDHRDWDAYIHDFRFAYNTAFHMNINATLAFLNMGREPRARKSFLRLGEGGNELPPADVSYWAARMSKLSHLRDKISQCQDQALPNVVASSFTRLLLSVPLSECRTPGVPQRVMTTSRNESMIFFELAALRGSTSIHFVNRS